jgi:glucokinase
MEPTKSQNIPVLIGDIGGTHSRLSLIRMTKVSVLLIINIRTLEMTFKRLKLRFYHQKSLKI